MPKVKIVCQKCGKMFDDYLSNHKKYCSRKCASHTLFRKGQIAHNKGIVGIVKQTDETKKKVSEASKRLWQKKGHRELVSKKISKTLMGHYVSKETKQKIKDNTPVRYGENHPSWAGDKIGYAGLHQWVQKTLGKAKICSECNSSKKVQWSNINWKYRRNINDWQELCYQCHREYDKGHWGAVKKRYNPVQ
jgi:HrpA-like RNA helicase